MTNPAFLTTFWIIALCFWLLILALAPVIGAQTLVEAWKAGEPFPWKDVL